MQIFVKTPTGKTVTLQVEDSTPVIDIKAKIEEKEGIPIHFQTLMNGNKILAENSYTLASYNVYNEATLQMNVWDHSNESVQMNKTDSKIQSKEQIDDKENGATGCDMKKKACETFQNKLTKSMTFEMNREVKKKTIAFMKLEERRIEMNQKVLELENEKDRNIEELKKRKMNKDKSHSLLHIEQFQALEEKNATDKKIIELQKDLVVQLNRKKKLDSIIKDKEIKMEKISEEHEIDRKQTEKENRKFEVEISTLKRKRGDIEKEENDLFKKKKANDGFLEFISNSIEEEKKDLECPVCCETARVPIFKCSMDHLICNECLLRLDICPECREPYANIPLRHRFAEKQIEKIKKLSEKRKAIEDGL